MTLRHSLFALALAGLMTGAAFAAPTKMMDTTLGSVLVDESGMTLYIFDKDTAGTADAPAVSNCYDQCAINWPPFLAAEGAMAEDDYTIIDRTDGTKQWAHKGWPLYYWKDDHVAGDVTGDGVGGVWHVVK